MIKKDILNKKITDIDFYIKNYYEGAELIDENILSLPNFTIKDLTNDRNSCSLVSLTRIINYYFPNLSLEEIYNYIIIFARKRGYHEECGTFPNFISEIAKSYFKFKKIPAKCRGIYFSNFYSHIKNEIDNKRPVIMNIGAGFYKNHTLNVIGYRIYKYKSLKIKILEVLDGWSREIRYLDYSALKGLLNEPFYSFNLLRLINQ